MSLRLKIVAIFNKNMKSLQRINWPELSRYCGCCPLSVGISIRCLISLMKIVAVVIFNGFYLSKIFDTKWVLNSVRIIFVNDEENVTLSNEELIYIQKTLVTLVAYEIMWMGLKFLHVWAVIATLFAIFCEKPQLLQVAFYTILPNWMFDIIIMLPFKLFVNPVFQIIFMIDTCYDGYNLMAMNSLYRQMARKSRIIPGDVLNNHNNNSDTPATTIIPFTETNVYQCVSCYNSSPVEMRSDNAQVNIPMETSEDISNDVATNDQESNEEKVLNFKDGPIIFNQEQLECQNENV